MPGPTGNPVEQWDLAVTVAGLALTMIGGSWLSAWTIGGKIDRVREESSRRGSDLHQKIDDQAREIREKLDNLRSEFVPLRTFDMAHTEMSQQIHSINDRLHGAMERRKTP